MIALERYIVSQEREVDADSYSVNLTLILIDDSNANIPAFSKELTSVSLNNKTGYEVDTQRETEISDYIATLN